MVFEHTKGTNWETVNILKQDLNKLQIPYEYHLSMFYGSLQISNSNPDAMFKMVTKMQVKISFLARVLLWNIWGKIDFNYLL
jgi:hypothetical protein